MYWTNFHNIDESKMKNISISNLTQIYYIIKIKYSKQLSTVKCLQTYCNFSFLFLFLHKCIMVLFLFFFYFNKQTFKVCPTHYYTDWDEKEKKKEDERKKIFACIENCILPRGYNFTFYFTFFISQWYKI